MPIELDVAALAEPTTDSDVLVLTSDQRKGTILPPGPRFRIDNSVERKGLFIDSPIRRVQGAAGDSQLHFAIEQQDADGAWHLASKPGQLLSPQWLMLTNAEISKMAQEVAILTGYDFEPVRCRYDGTRYEYYLESPSFRNRIGDLREIERGNHSSLDPNDPNGDYIALGIRAINTFDGSLRPRVEVYVMRLVCWNGAILKEGLFSYTFTQKISENGGAQEWDQELHKAGYELRNLHTRFEEYGQKLVQLRETPVGMDELTMFSRALPKTFPSTVYGNMVRRFLDFEEPTAFGLYNAATYVTWHAPGQTQADLDRNADLVSLISGDLFLN